jgi:hypothetical protein
VQVAYEYDLARFYMWAQTECCVYLVCNIPTGKHTPRHPPPLLPFGNQGRLCFWSAMLFWERGWP